MPKCLAIVITFIEFLIQYDGKKLSWNGARITLPFGSTILKKQCKKNVSWGKYLLDLTLIL